MRWCRIRIVGFVRRTSGIRVRRLQYLHVILWRAIIAAGTAIIHFIGIISTVGAPVVHSAESHEIPTALILRITLLGIGKSRRKESREEGCRHYVFDVNHVRLLLHHSCRESSLPWRNIELGCVPESITLSMHAGIAEIRRAIPLVRIANSVLHTPCQLSGHALQKQTRHWGHVTVWEEPLRNALKDGRNGNDSSPGLR